MDVFSKQNAAAKLRHASPERQTPVEEPSQDHDTEGSVSPLPLNPALRTATDDSDGAVSAYRGVPSYEPTFSEQLEAERPQLLESFKAYDKKKNIQIKGYHDLFIALNQREAERLGNVIVPENETFDFLDHLATTLPEKLEYRENAARMGMAVMHDSSGSDDAGTLQPRTYDSTRHQVQDGYVGCQTLEAGETTQQPPRSSVLEPRYKYPAPPLNRNLNAFPGGQPLGTAEMTEQQLRSNVLESDLSFSANGEARFSYNEPATRQNRSDDETSFSDYDTEGSPSRRRSSHSSPESGARQPRRAFGGRLSNPSHGPTFCHFTHTNDRGLPHSLVQIDLMVKFMLLPIFTVPRTREDAHDIDVVDRLSAAARQATTLIRRSDHYSTPEGSIIHGRCCFYVGFSRVLKAKADGFDHRPHRWLRRAMADAKGLPEATMAKELLESLTPAGSFDTTRSPVSSAQSPTATEAARPTTADSAVSASVNVRPSTAGSWVGGVWGKVAQAMGRSGNGANLAPPPFEILEIRDPLLSPLVSPKDTSNMAEEPDLIPMEFTAQRLIPITKGKHKVPMSKGRHTGETLILDHYGVPYSDKRPFFADAEFVISPEYLPGHFDQPNPNLPTGGLVDASNLHRLRRGRVRDASYSDPATRGVPADLFRRSELSLANMSEDTIQEQPNDDTTQEQAPPPSPKRGYRVLNPDPSSSSENSAPPVKQSVDIVPPEGAILPLHNTRQPLQRTMSYEPPDQSATDPAKASRSPRKSVVFATSLLENLTSPTRSSGGEARERQGSLSSAVSSVGSLARRRLSQAFNGGLQAISTVREVADPLATAEEGNSPFLEVTFGSAGSGAAGKKQKKKSEKDGLEELPKTPKSPDEMV